MKKYQLHSHTVTGVLLSCNVIQSRQKASSINFLTPVFLTFTFIFLISNGLR